MITQEDIALYIQRVKTSIRDKVKRASISRGDISDRFDELAGFIADLQQNTINDQTLSETSTWSSKKISEALADNTVTYEYIIPSNNGTLNV